MPTLRERLKGYEERTALDVFDEVLFTQLDAVLAAAEAWAQAVRLAAGKTPESFAACQVGFRVEELLALFPPPDAKETP